MSANFLRKSLYAASLLVLSGVVAFAPSMQPAAMAQTNNTGDISGAVTDPTGAAVPGAAVKVTNEATGTGPTTTTGGRGDYRVPFLAPGKYDVSIAAAGFEGVKVTVTVSAGSTAIGDAKLIVGKATTVVDVTETQPLLHTEDAQISTSFDLQQIQSLPNPGNDLTFVAQTTPGVVMNTQGGYGNFSVNGLPGTSNTFTINGGYEGDPYLNLNNSGATNLLLGNNDVDTVTVTTNAYDAAFGGLGGAQVNEISRSGGNGYHGNATYWWNGSVLNANSYFNNLYGSPKGRDNVNQWAAAIGGPIKKDKWFFFADYEGLRVIIPLRGPVYAPSPAYQATILNPAPITNGYAPYGNLAANGLSVEAPVYQDLFSYYNNARNASTAIADPNGDLDTVLFNGQTTNFGREYLFTGRTDFVIGPNDHMFIHTKIDQGVQPTQSSFLDPIFEAQSPQPSYEGQLNEVHTFTPNLTNNFLFAASYYRAIFINTNTSQIPATLPFNAIPEGFSGPANCDPAVISCVQGTTGGSWDLAGNPANWVGGADYAFPQGRNVTGYQFTDDLSWTKGNHTIKLGWTMRRDDISDYTPSERTFSTKGPENIILDQGDFAAGYTDEYVERFPTTGGSNPVALYVMGGYIQDQWKAAPNLTVTAGLRLEHNSNPICQINCFSNLTNEFDQTSTDTTTPYNQILQAYRKQAFPSLQTIAYEPRVGFSWQPFGAGSKTVIRGGFGMFADYFPGQIAGDLLSNSPNVNRFTVLGAYFGDAVTFDSSQPDSGHALAVISNTAFEAGFPTGASYSSLLTSTGGLFRRPTVIGVAPKVYSPTYEEYSLALEQQIGRNTAASVMYVGNHGYHEPAPLLPNAYDPYGTNATLPLALPNPNIASVTQYYSGASSNYNGLLATVTEHARWLSLQFNYAWSHALDEISNGGFDAFGVNPVGQINPYNLAQQYGNADYDVRNYISASYVITVPYWGGPRVLTAGWEVSGTIFHNDGYKFSDYDDSGAVVYGNSPLALQLGNNFNHSCGGESHTTTPCSFANYFTSSTDFGQQSRNQLTGPHFTDFDLDVAKAFQIPKWESGKLKLAAQFFNTFNHPNFQIPFADVNDGASNGLIYANAQTPTSILGAFLGGDSSPRLIQLKASLVF